MKRPVVHRSSRSSLCTTTVLTVSTIANRDVGMAWCEAEGRGRGSNTTHHQRHGSSSLANSLLLYV